MGNLRLIYFVILMHCDMITIIICSISSDRLLDIKCNIDQTIGVEYEIISIDNKEKKWSIAKAYNYGAKMAKYPYLLFVHEDVKFHSQGWGGFIIQKLMEPDCGVVGFAGAKVRLDCYSGWGYDGRYHVTYLYQGLGNGLAEFYVSHAYMNRPFSEVIVLDGLALFVKKDVWEQYPFDEELLTGFHCYDIDFTMQISVAHYRNYVCCSNNCLIEHFSSGSFDKDWYSMTVRMHEKWRYLLPIYTNDVALNSKIWKRNEENCSYDFLKRMLKADCPFIEKRMVLKEYWLRPFSWRHFKRCVKMTINLLMYR